jgi:hypothetical protein
MLMFMAVALAAAAWFVFVPQQQGFDSGRRVML